jgi:plastocyanin
MHTVLAAVLLAAAVGSPAPDAAVTVHIKDDAFKPAVVTVHAGERVAFVNDDDDAHTATADDQSWDSEGLNRGERWVHVFAKSGRIAYHCTVHPFMKGTIVVEPAR